MPKTVNPASQPLAKPLESRNIQEPFIGYSNYPQETTFVAQPYFLDLRFITPPKNNKTRHMGTNTSCNGK